MDKVTRLPRRKLTAAERRKLLAEAEAIFGPLGSGSLASSLGADEEYGHRCRLAINQLRRSKR